MMSSTERRYRVTIDRDAWAHRSFHDAAGASGNGRETESAVRRYWQVTGRNDASEAGAERYGWKGESSETGQKTPIQANSINYQITLARLKNVRRLIRVSPASGKQ